MSFALKWKAKLIDIQNYRVGLANAEVRDYIKIGQLDDLFAADQLVHAMGDAEVFVGYEEGPITFLCVHWSLHEQR